MCSYEWNGIETIGQMEKLVNWLGFMAKELIVITRWEELEKEGVKKKWFYLPFCSG